MKEFVSLSAKGLNLKKQIPQIDKLNLSCFKCLRYIVWCGFVSYSSFHRVNEAILACKHKSHLLGSDLWQSVLRVKNSLKKLIFWLNRPPNHELLWLPTSLGSILTHGGLSWLVHELLDNLQLANNALPIEKF